MIVITKNTGTEQTVILPSLLWQILKRNGSISNELTTNEMDTCNSNVGSTVKVNVQLDGKPSHNNNLKFKNDKPRNWLKLKWTLL